MGGGRFSNCSMLEAIALCERITQHQAAAGSISTRIAWEIISGGLGI